MNPSIHIQQQTGDKKRWSPVSIQPRTVWKPQSHWLLAKPQPGVRRSSDPAPPGEDKVTPQHHNPSIYLQLPQTGDETSGSQGRHRTARRGSPSSAGSLLIFNLGFVRLARPGEDKLPSPHHESFHIYIYNPSNRERKWWTPGSIPPRTVWKPQPHWLRAKSQRGVRRASATCGG